MSKFTLLLVGLLAFPCLVNAQEFVPQPVAPLPENFFSSTSEEVQGDLEAVLAVRNANLELQLAMVEASKGELVLQTEVRRRAYEWQHFSTVMIFWLVIIIVGIGLYLSIQEFRKGLQTSSKGLKGEDKQIIEPTQSSFMFNLQGIEIKSSLIGLMIFAISLAFFYLYLNFVYPIQVEGSTPPPIEIED